MPASERGHEQPGPGAVAAARRRLGAGRARRVPPAAREAAPLGVRQQRSDRSLLGERARSSARRVSSARRRRACRRENASGRSRPRARSTRRCSSDRAAAWRSRRRRGTPAGPSSGIDVDEGLLRAGEGGDDGAEVTLLLLGLLARQEHLQRLGGLLVLARRRDDVRDAVDDRRLLLARRQRQHVASSASVGSVERGRQPAAAPVHGELAGGEPLVGGRVGQLLHAGRAAVGDEVGPELEALPGPRGVSYPDSVPSALTTSPPAWKIVL